jgi:hypothetical protein
MSAMAGNSNFSLSKRLSGNRSESEEADVEEDFGKTSKANVKANEPEETRRDTWVGRTNRKWKRCKCDGIESKDLWKEEEGKGGKGRDSGRTICAKPSECKLKLNWERKMKSERSVYNEEQEALDDDKELWLQQKACERSRSRGRVRQEKGKGSNWRLGA